MKSAYSSGTYVHYQVFLKALKALITKEEHLPPRKCEWCRVQDERYPPPARKQDHYNPVKPGPEDL